MIYATVGTLFLDFPRLVNALDKIAIESGEQIVVQTGLGTTLPRHCEHFDFKSRGDVLAIQRDARVIVTHGGIGSILDALNVRRPLVVVPRLKKFKEHLDDHQLDVAAMVEKRGWGRMICDMDDLAAVLTAPPPVPTDYQPGKHRLVQAIQDKIERVAALRR
ncbi:MAG: beta-1,4-galactosyltransferase [Candidatus Hydrogenedentes bacterium]|nr:beta-1,4-galactosyltransferase [Candidatus Hydrogenedentota bacterium]